MTSSYNQGKREIEIDMDPQVIVTGQVQQKGKWAIKWVLIHNPSK